MLRAVSTESIFSEILSVLLFKPSETVPNILTLEFAATLMLLVVSPVDHL
jgi:hypothetical protein